MKNLGHTGSFCFYKHHTGSIKEHPTVKAPSQNTGNKSRDLSLDFLKSISVVLVVFFHNMQLNPDSIADNLFMMWGNAAVPVFFLVSGALFFTRPFSWKRHIYHILRFYLAMTAWKAIYLAIYHFLGVPFPASRRQLLTYLLLFGDIDGVSTGHLWFIEGMLAVLLAAPFLRVCMERDRNAAVYLLALCFVFNQLVGDANFVTGCLARIVGKEAWNVGSFAEINPLSFQYSNYMFFYMLGGFLQEKKQEKAVSLKANAAMTAVGLMGLMMIKYVQSGTFRWQNTHLSSGYYWISTILIAVGMFLSAAYIPMQNTRSGVGKLVQGFSKAVGTSTLGIFYLHIPLIHILTPRLFQQAAAFNGWTLNLLESLAIVAVCWGIVWAGRKLPVIRWLF